MQTCAICNKKPIVGRSIARRGLPKKTGGVGLKTTGITRRRFMPNLQKIKVLFPNGKVRKVNVCTKCIKSGNVKKAVKYRPALPSAAKSAA